MKFHRGPADIRILEQSPEVLDRERYGSSSGVPGNRGEHDQSSESDGVLAFETGDVPKKHWAIHRRSPDGTPEFDAICGRGCDRSERDGTKQDGEDDVGNSIHESVSDANSWGMDRSRDQRPRLTTVWRVSSAALKV